LNGRTFSDIELTQILVLVEQRFVWYNMLLLHVCAARSMSEVLQIPFLHVSRLKHGQLLQDLLKIHFAPR
jgi:hypothetical protein